MKFASSLEFSLQMRQLGITAEQMQEWNNSYFCVATFFGNPHGAFQKAHPIAESGFAAVRNQILDPSVFG
jgi:hypothetical protein